MGRFGLETHKRYGGYGMSINLESNLHEITDFNYWAFLGEGHTLDLKTPAFSYHLVCRNCDKTYPNINHKCPAKQQYSSLYMKWVRRLYFLLSGLDNSIKKSEIYALRALSSGHRNITVTEVENLYHGMYIPEGYQHVEAIDGLNITPEQTEQGRKFLRNSFLTVKTKNIVKLLKWENLDGTTDSDEALLIKIGFLKKVISSFYKFEFLGFTNKTFFYPVYKVRDTNGNEFSYYYDGLHINVINGYNGR